METRNLTRLVKIVSTVTFLSGIAYILLSLAILGA
jgi:hypothetical protein